MLAVPIVIGAPLRLRSQWEDDRTLVYQASRALVPGEVGRIAIDRLVDALGRPRFAWTRMWLGPFAAARLAGRREVEDRELGRAVDPHR